MKLSRKSKKVIADAVIKELEDHYITPDDLAEIIELELDTRNAIRIGVCYDDGKSGQIANKSFEELFEFLDDELDNAKAEDLHKWRSLSNKLARFSHKIKEHVILSDILKEKQ